VRDHRERVGVLDDERGVGVVGDLAPAEVPLAQRVRVRERALALGGEVAIRRNPTRGTTVEVILPR